MREGWDEPWAYVAYLDGVGKSTTDISQKIGRFLQILNQFRTYFPKAIALMMDQETLDIFGHSEGERCANQNLQMLTNKEQQLYQYLRENDIRLEQEKITHSYAESKIYSIVKDKEGVFEN